MAELLTIARPYAEAAFKLATDTQVSGADTMASLASWGDALNRLATVASRPELRNLLGNPKVTTQQVVQLMGDAAGAMNEPQKNFLSVLAGQERLGALSEVEQHFSALRSQFESTLEAEVTSAFALSDAQVAEIVSTLAAKYGKKIKATVKVDNALIGGVSIRVGDEVTDVSVRGKLAQLRASLMA